MRWGRPSAPIGEQVSSLVLEKRQGWKWGGAESLEEEIHPTLPCTPEEDVRRLQTGADAVKPRARELFIFLSLLVRRSRIPDPCRLALSRVYTCDFELLRTNVEYLQSGEHERWTVCGERFRYSWWIAMKSLWDSVLFLRSILFIVRIYVSIFFSPF
ncbi:hypothetical protein CEXT_631361 [Caerostris extrusa]|uniref:Uncharacterized protein n=1 Tax=Caerostris extrusa TaxID=172846 RepID=A0AAV4Y995_CAEEX|nr:hypothetical protein CEXT_631361 [Caerostris extrusa]